MAYQTELKDVLRQLAVELIDLRATLDVLTKPQKTYGGVLDAKKDALAEHQKTYKDLLEKIERLSL